MPEEVSEEVTTEEVASETPSQDDRTAEQLQEDEARTQGWVPQEEWIEQGKDALQWRKASDFIDRGSFFSKISSLNKKIDELSEDKSYSNKIIKELYDQNKKIQENSYNQAMKDLRQEVRSARKEEEYDKADALEDQMEELRDNKPQFEELPEEKSPKTEQETLNEFYDNWANSPENSWYLKDQVVQDSFNGVFQRISRTRPELSPEQRLEQATAEIKQTFPDKFRTGAPSPVVGRTGKTGNGKVDDKKKIDYNREDIGELRAIGKRFVEAELFKTVEEYLESEHGIKDVDTPTYIGKKDGSNKTA